MHQDFYGFMWFGTYDGLNLYNGKDVATFRFESDNPNSLSGNTIHNISSSGDYFLWISTQLGLNRFSLKERIVVESYPEYKRTAFIVSDKAGNTWLIHRDSYISFYDVHKKSFEEIPFAGNHIADIRSFFFDRNGHLCLVKKNGFLQYISLETKVINGKNVHSISSKEINFHNRTINQVFYERDLIYFIDEDMNMFFYDATTQQKIILRNIAGIISKYGIISNISFFHNKIYIAFMHSGLMKIDVSSHNEPEFINMTIGVFCLLRDRYQDAMWVGTDGTGVGMYYSEKDKFGNILLENLPFTARKPVRGFYTDEENTLWIGTKGNGIIRIKDYEKFSNARIPSDYVQHFITDEGLPENPVYCFFRSKYNKDDLWIGTDGNISCYSYRDKKIHKVEDPETTGRRLTNVHTLCEINDSILYVSSSGLYEVVIDKSRKPYRIKSKKSHVFRKDGNDIMDEYYSMIFDGDSVVTIGSRSGYGAVKLNVYNGNYRFISISKAENRAIGDIIALHISENTGMYYLGASSGLTEIKMTDGKEDEIRQFNRKDGIINDMIHGILEDNSGIIWLSTNKGLVKYNPMNASFFNVKSSQIGVVEYSDDAYWRCPITDRLFFGGVNGLTWIEPKNDREISEYVPNLLFTDLVCFGECKTLYEYNKNNTKKLKLPARKNTFQISFAVLDYINGDNYDYSYILENYNTHWISLQKDNKINFTNLPPGDYVLKVKYKNDVTQNDDRIYSLPIVILHPRYLSTPACITYVFLMILLILSLIYYIRRKFRQKQNTIAKKIMEEQKEKLYESKLKFFTNITHELYTPLTLINVSLEQIKKEEDYSGNARMKKYVGILQNNALNLNELIKEILDYRKIEESEIKPCTLKNISITALMNNLLASFSDAVQQNSINLITSIPDNLFWDTDKACFKKIVFNLASNAFKYTPVGGTVKINISVENKSLRIVVFNTGKGIEQDKIKIIFNRYSILENTDVNANNQMTARNGLGLFICHSMVKLLQGEISVESVPNEYAQFTVVLPNLIETEIPETENEEKLQNQEIKTENNDETDHKTVTQADNNSTIHVLVVDDNREIVEIVADILSPYYAVLKAFSVKDALRILKNITPSLIITDIMMPDIDGLSFINMIRNNKFNRHLPIIVLSAKVDEKEHVKGYEAGADAYINKPFSSQELLSIVHRFVVNKKDIRNYYSSAESVFEYTYGKLVHQEDREFISSVIKIINDNLSNPDLGPEFIGARLKMSARNLWRQFRRILNVTPNQFIKDYRFSYAAKLLVATDLSVKEILLKMGISNKSYFHNEFFKRYNTTPLHYRNANRKDE
jgi:signal transduction histidine kinase/AraC-like DNA-binding protein/ligand-binding sensor domain-containing protein